MVTKTKNQVRMSRRDWERLKKSPQFGDLIDLLEERTELEAAKKVRGKELTLNQYLGKRGARDHR